MARLARQQAPNFAVDIFQNPYLGEGASRVDAIVTVTASGGAGQAAAAAGQAGAGAAGAPNAAVVIMVDCSGSMDYPPTKIRNAREATAAAIAEVRDGVAFAVVAGSHQAREVYPGDGTLAVASAETREEARQALRRLTPAGGTAIGTWLTQADKLFASRPEATLRHGILLTDGRNEHEKPEQLQRTLDKVRGRFTADCRGVGTEWEVAELRRISETLLGTVAMVADPAELAADFRQMMAQTMDKQVADVALRVWTPLNARVLFVKQVSPSLLDLTELRRDAGGRSGDYPTGSWGDESRDYHVCLEVPPQPTGSAISAGRISLVVPQPDGSTEVLSNDRITAAWTDDLSATTSINPQVAHYTGQAELVAAIQEGLAAQQAGDRDMATSRLGRAVQIAHESGNADTYRLLAKVVDVVDAREGTVRIPERVSKEARMELDTFSTKTRRQAD